MKVSHAKPQTTDRITELLQHYSEWSGRLAAALDGCVGELIKAEGPIHTILYYRKILTDVAEANPVIGDYLLNKIRD
jgi:hypothetical protein